MRYDENGQCFIIKSKSDWDNYRAAEILLIEDWKAGVKRLHVRDVNANPPWFRLVYCKDEFLPDPTVQRYANAHGVVAGNRTAHSCPQNKL